MCSRPADDTCRSLYMSSFHLQMWKLNFDTLHWQHNFSLIFNNVNKASEQKEREQSMKRDRQEEGDRSVETGANPTTQKSSIFHWGGTKRAAPVGATQKLSMLPVDYFHSLPSISSTPFTMNYRFFLNAFTYSWLLFFFFFFYSRMHSALLNSIHTQPGVLVPQGGLGAVVEWLN